MKSWKMFFIVCLVTVFTVFAVHAIRTEGTGVNTPRVQKTVLTQGVNTNFGNVPLYFIPNNGQMDGNALFYARTASYTLWMTESGLIFDSVKAQSAERDVSRLIFMNAGKNPAVVPEDPAAHKVNYLRGSDKSGWHTNIPTSKAVRYKDLYRGIDLKVYGTEKQIEYDWVVKPGAEPKDICFRYEHVKESRIDDDGNLVIQTASGLWTHKKPVAYQRVEGEKVTVAAEFKKQEGGKHTYGFDVGTYDGRYELVIDPIILTFSTYLGGNEEDRFTAVAFDDSENVYAVGHTFSTDFPTLNAYQGMIGGYVFGAADSVVFKFSPDGTGLIYSTYLGGYDDDYALALAVDAGGTAYVAGYTGGSDFPTANAYQGSTGGYYDGFISKLSSDGSTLLYSTYLGGYQYDRIEDIALDAGGAVYVTGKTGGGFPVQNAYQGTYGGGLYDAFVTKLSSDGSSLVFSTFLGGSGEDSATGIAVAGSGEVFAAGSTDSGNFPTVNALQGSLGGGFDGFVTKFSADGSAPVYSTYLGGSAADYINGIGVDGNNKAYVAGETHSSNFPTTTGTFQEAKAGTTYDGFVTGLAADGLSFTYSTYLGATGGDTAVKAIAVGSFGNAYVTGQTDSTNFPIRYPLQDTLAGSGNYPDAFVTIISWVGDSISSSTYFGGAGDDVCIGIAINDYDAVYLTGVTMSGDFPTGNAVQGTYGGGASDGFVTKFTYTAPPPITVVTPNGGETLPIDEYYEITWWGQSILEGVRLEYSIDGGNTWLPIVVTANDESHFWRVPDTPSATCLLKASDAGGTGWDVSDAFFTIGDDASLTVDWPNGGENLEMGYPYQITWTTTGQVDNVYIEFSSDGGGSWEPISGLIPNTGYYDWNAHYVDSDQCLVKVKHEFLPVEDQSDGVFTISPPTITVTEPMGGEQWMMGYNYMIQWTTTGQVENVFLEFSSDGGSSWEPIDGPIPNTGYYDWIAPYVDSDQCLIRVRHETLPVQDQNDTYFTILPPTITVTEPIGGEEWTGGAPYQIQWTSTGQVDNVILSFSGNGGGTWEPIDGPVPNTGYYDWTTPVIASDQCLVKVEHETLSSVFGQSGVFTITASSIPSTERDALIALYNSTNGDNWTVNDNWRLPSDPSQFNVPGTEHTWAGVTCSTDGSHVEKIDLYAYGLNGTIPAQLNDLTQLTSLDLHTNQLSGTIPVLNNLSLLTGLNLSENQLTGTVPDLSGSVNLEQLRLHSNQLDGTLPAWLNTLTGLTILELQYNQFTGTIPSLGNLIALERLNLSSNQLTGSIPADLGNLTSLRLLYLDNNRLTGSIPGQLGNLTGLNILFLHGNNLVGALPSGLSNLTALYNAGLNISWNGLYTSDSFLRDFLNTKHASDWEATQTVAPDGLRVDAQGYYSIRLAWIPIPYQSDSGGYKVYFSTVSGSGFTLAGITADKYAGTFTVTGLSPETAYYFIVRTVTDSHANNQNTVLSGYTPEVSGATSALPVMTVTAPDGGESWEAGTTRTITWSSTGSVDDVALEYSVNGGTSWQSITASTKNTGSYDWVVPAEDSTDCLVRVSDTVTGRSDTSNAVFTIWQQPFLIVTSPNGGESWPELSTQTITWVSAGYTGDVVVRYTVDNGKKWREVATLPAGAGSCQWELPRVNGDKTQSLVRITASDESVEDVSDAYFTVLNL